MRSFYFVWVAFMLQFGALCAQSELPALNLKFGKPTDAEMRMTEYPLDTTASAVILMQSCDLKYHMSTMYEISMRYTFKVRIKVLKEEGKSYGDLLIPYVCSENSGENEYNEVIEEFSAVAYNLNEKGKPTASKVSDAMIFDERVDEYHRVKKFSVPQVRKGTVIEYKYELFSPRYFQIYDYLLQREIPIIYSNLHMEIPAVLQFNVSAPTIHPQVVCSVKTGSLTLDNGNKFDTPTRVATNCYDITAHNMQAVRSDDYVWCPADYCGRVE